jgi:hypothetical protein
VKCVWYNKIVFKDNDQIYLVFVLEMHQSDQAGDRRARISISSTNFSTADTENGVLARGNPTEVAGILLCFAWIPLTMQVVVTKAAFSATLSSPGEPKVPAQLVAELQMLLAAVTSQPSQRNVKVRVY